MLIDYEEEKRIFSKIYDYMASAINSYTFGFIENLQIYSHPPLLSMLYDNYICRAVIKVHIHNQLKGIHQYKRKAKSIFDYLSNIAALTTSLFSGIWKVFGFLYSKNFDNYKIIDNILTKEKIYFESNNNFNSDDIFNDKDLEKIYSRIKIWTMNQIILKII